MNRLILPYIFILFCIMCACQDIEDLPTQADKVNTDIISLNVTVSDNVESGNPASRAKDEGLSTYFVPGDSVGVIILDKAGQIISNNAKFVLSDDNKWTYKGHSNNTPCYNVEMQTYIVYFPYEESVTDANCSSAKELLSLPVFKHKEDQTSTDAYRYTDVMAWESSEGPSKEITAKLRHLRNGVSLDITVQWTLLTGEEITFKIPDEAAIKDKDGKNLETHQAEDGSFRYILPDGYEGEITYFYNYRDLMFKGAFEVQSSQTGTLYSRYETVDMGDYTYDQVIVGDFYCKNSDNIGFVLPCEATKYLDNSNHRCIGLVFYTGQSDKDGIEDTYGNRYSYDYIQTGIADNECHGYVLALTDAQNDLENMFEWELDYYYNPYEEGLERDWLELNVSRDDWGGYYNTLYVMNYCEEYSCPPNCYPAVYAAYYYGNLATGTYEDEYGDIHTILFNNREETMSSGIKDDYNPYEWQEPLKAPGNTSGWYLPGSGQLRELRSYQTLFEQRYNQIKEKLTDEVPYKEHIGWVKYHHTWRGVPYYWTSTKSNFDARVNSQDFSQQFYLYPNHKGKAFAVRPVLAY